MAASSADCPGAVGADLLCEANCLFGGGTAMALRIGEYRESVDRRSDDGIFNRDVIDLAMMSIAALAAQGATQGSGRLRGGDCPRP